MSGLWWCCILVIETDFSKHLGCKLDLVTGELGLTGVLSVLMVHSDTVYLEPFGSFSLLLCGSRSHLQISVSQWRSSVSRSGVCRLGLVARTHHGYLQQQYNERLTQSFTDVILRPLSLCWLVSCRHGRPRPSLTPLSPPARATTSRRC